MRTRKPKTYYVTRGHLTASGASKSEAKANLSVMVDRALSASSLVVESRFGLVVIVAPDPNGYYCGVFNPAELAHGERRWCFTLTQAHYTDALQSARIHAAQNAWNAAVESDQDFVTAAQVGTKAGELLSWIAFQRRYIAAKQAGHDDGMAWRIASNDPTLPREAA